MEEILKKLVEFKSITADKAANKELLNFLEQQLSRTLLVTQFESNGYHSLVAIPRHIKNPKVFLVAHSDVVPGHEQQFSLIRKDGKYISRGILDMKFAIASYLKLVDELANEIERYSYTSPRCLDRKCG